MCELVPARSRRCPRPGACSALRARGGPPALAGGGARCLDLAEEVGELARAVLVDVFALADHYHVELDELYPHLLARPVAGHPGRAGGAGNDPGGGWKEGPR